MANMLVRVNKEELKELIEAAVEEKLLELLGDPDEGLELEATLRERLVRQQRAVAKGERGEAFEDVIRELGLIQLTTS